MVQGPGFLIASAEAVAQTGRPTRHLRSMAGYSIGSAVAFRLLQFSSWRWIVCSGQISDRYHQLIRLKSAWWNVFLKACRDGTLPVELRQRKPFRAIIGNLPPLQG